LTYRTREALPTPLAPQRFDRSSAVAYRLPALLTLGQPKIDMTILAVGIAFIDCKADIVVLECAVSGYSEVHTTITHRTGPRGREEGVAAFSAEEVLLVVRALTQCFIV
jgi:hypothetical protein